MSGERSPAVRPLAWLRVACIMGALSVGILDTWFYLDWNLNPDGVSYLDIARAFLAHGPSALVNGYWSPLYPAAIGAGLAVASPDPGAMYPVVRVVGLIVYLLTIASYDRLVNAMLARVTVADAARVAFLVTAWALFFVFVSQAIGLFLATPDMGVAALVFFIAAELLSIGDAPWTFSRWIRLGVLFGIGYWWKAILFPVSGIAWLLATALAARRRDGWRGPIAAAAVFGTLALALAIPVSQATGRVTFGETGRLNQLWFVSNVPYAGELCLPPGAMVEIEGIGAPRTMPVIAARPLTCRLESTLAEATLPIWFDPAPLYRDLRNRFDAAELSAAIRSDDGEVLDALDQLMPFSTVAVSAIIGGATLAALAPIATGGPAAMALFATVPIFAYVSVYVELRHIVPFIVCLALWGLTTLLIRHPRVGAGALWLVFSAAVVDSGVRVFRQQRVEAAIAFHQLRGEPRGTHESSLVASALSARGFKRGDAFAPVYATWNADWAQRGGFVVRAFVPEFTYPVGRAVAELSDECLRGEYGGALRDAGIQALVLRKAPGIPVPPGFEGIEGTRFHLLDLRSAAPAPRCPR